MPSPFAKYQSEQVQQLAPGFVEAYGNAGRSVGQGLASAGESITKGLQIADQKRKEEIATRAKLAPYIRNDDRITATEGMIKSGLLTKADDGTVVISAKWDKYADKEGLKKYLDFYNQTGGDGSKLKGDALIEFANRFEGEQKFIAEKAANLKAKTETDLKDAQIAKLRAEAAAKAAETGLVADIMRGFGGGAEVPSSPTAGINLTQYTANGGTITSTTPSVTTVSNTVPGVAAPAATPAAAPATAEPAVSPALTAGTKATKAKDEVATLAAGLGMTKAGLIESATRNGVTPQEYAATLQSVLDARGKGKAAPASTEPEVKTWADAAFIVGEEEQMARYRGERLAGMTPAEYVANWKESQAAKNAPEPAKDEIDTLAAEAGMTRDELLEASRISGVTPQEHINNLRAVAKAAAKAAPAASEPAPSAGPDVVSADAQKAREIKKLTDEQMVLNEYLMRLDEDRVDNPNAMAVIEALGKIVGLEHIAKDADGNVVVSGKDSKVIRQRFAANAKRLVELRGEGEAAAPAAEPTVSPALREGTTGTPAAAAQAEQAAAPAAEATRAAEVAQMEQRATAAGTPIPETYDVAAESVAVKERLDKVNADRETVRTKYTAIRTRNAATIARQRQQALALGVVAPQKASAITSYLDNSVKFENEAEARELKALDEKEAAINRDFANYQAAAGAKAKEKTELRLDRASVLAEKRAEVEAKDAKQQRISDYPTIGIWTHLGANMDDPSKYNIRKLSPTAQVAVNEANEGYRTATDFLLRMSDTLQNRKKGDTTWRNRFRVTAENMQNYFEGELASVFGVATFRRGIVSGGNFSDADREFVKSAITYLNTAAPDMSAEDLQASMSALSVFINRMYVKKLEAYDMVYDPDSARSQAALLRKDGLDRKAEFVEAGINEADLFYRRFNIKPPMKSGKAESQTQVKAAMDLLYPLMEKKGLTKGFNRTDITIDK